MFTTAHEVERMNLMERRKIFGRWLRDCRKHARITQAELAQALHYESSQLISNIERGVSLLPSKRLPDFARVLGCSLLEMEVRYFQCSARNTSESRMPDLLLKYLPLIERMEFGQGTDAEILAAIQSIRSGQTLPSVNAAASSADLVGNDNQADLDDDDDIDDHDDPTSNSLTG
jgi:transcriptional regulator with XRE-family HTH domain